MTNPTPPRGPRSETVMVSSGSTASGLDPMASRMREHLGPFAVDSSARTLITTCWRSLPEERRNVEEVERQVRTLTERALAEFREDSVAFGFA